MVYQWERLARQFESLGTRVIIGRFGMVLSNQGGALPLMKLPYDLNVGGKIGSGRQWYSWIHIEDLTRAILYTINNEKHAAYLISHHLLQNIKICLVIPLQEKFIAHTIHGYLHLHSDLS